MVKRTRFGHHPVEFQRGTMVAGQEYAGLILLEILSAALDSGSLSDGRGTLLLNDLAAAAGIDVPAGASAIIVNVASQDSGGAGAVTYMAFGYGGIVDTTNYPGRSATIHNQYRNDEWTERLMIIPLTESNIIDYLAEASGGSTLDYVLKLVGWIVAGAAYTKPSDVGEDLKCIFEI